MGGIVFPEGAFSAVREYVAALDHGGRDGGEAWRGQGQRGVDARLTRGRSEERLLPILRERIASPNISGRAVTAHQNFLASPLPETSADFSRSSPDQLRVMRDIHGQIGRASRRERVWQYV